MEATLSSYLPSFIFDARNDDILQNGMSLSSSRMPPTIQEKRKVNDLQFCLFILICSLLLLCQSLSRFFRQGLGVSSERYFPIKPLYEIGVQTVRTTYLALVIQLSIQSDFRSSGELILASYAYILGFIRLAAPATGSWRARLLHHTNSIYVTLFLVSLFKDIGPTVFVTTHVEPSALILAKVASVTAIVFISAITPRPHQAPPISFETAHRSKLEGASPEETCSYFSYYVSYGWLTSRILRGCRRRLSMDDMLPLPHYDEPLRWRSRIIEARKKFSTTLWTLAWTLSPNILGMICFAALTSVAEFIAPLALYKLLQYLQDPHNSRIRPMVWVILLFVGPMFRSIAYQQYIFTSTRLIVRTKLSLIQELYDKALSSLDQNRPDDGFQNDETKTQLSGGASPTGDLQLALDPEKRTAKSTEGHISNLMAYDVDAIVASRDFILVCVAFPIEIGIAMTFIYNLLGYSSFFGLAFMILSFPIVGFLSRKMSRLQREVMKKTDQRITLVNEYLNSLRTIKHFAWENVMADNINQARDEEQHFIWKRNLYAVAVIVIGDFMPLFTLFIMFATFTLGAGCRLDPAVAFTTLTVVEILRLQFTWVSNVTRFYSQASVALKRLDDFFSTAKPRTRHPVGPPQFKSATFRRADNIDSFKLVNLDVSFKEGRLNVIVGPSGSGKTSLLLSLLGETIQESGSATSPSDVSYASQSAWLLGGTIRDNILFYAEFEQSRYDAVIWACGLLQDFSQLPEGHLYVISDGGTGLSGGQKQRVALARALYSKASLLLLDDIFSALDVPTAQLVFERCFRSNLLQGRTIILVTQNAWMMKEASLTVKMQNGFIMSVKSSHLTEVFPQYLITIPQDSGTNRALSSNTSRIAPSDESSSVKVDNEVAGQKRNPRTLVYKYLVLFGGNVFAILTILASFAVQIAFFSITLWLSIWVGAYSKEQAINVGFYVGVYGCVILSFTLLSALNNLNYQRGAWAAARRMHQELVTSVFSVSLNWFNMNPVGRVVNRFSRDIFSMDSMVVDYLRITVDNALRLLLRIGGIGSIMPIFALPTATVCVFGFIMAEMYTRTQLSVKALASASQSPVFSHFSHTVNGLAVIRADARLPEVFADALARHLRVYARAAETQYNLNRWICVRADFLAASVACAAGALALSRIDSVSPGLVGFSLTNAIGLSQTILNLVRNMNELEIELNCFQRVREYASLQPEESEEETAVANENKELLDHWPLTGKIEFRNVTASYAEDAPAVIKNVSFTIAPGSRVAIIGRTGSGKSTLALSLLRFTHIISGSILIDGVDITKISRRELRSRIAFIPQDPILFTGDVESNLDPGHAVPQPELNRILEDCATVDTLSINNQSLTLSTPVHPNGSNFSLGQKQILSLARALARGSSVTVLDEATASVDQETDAKLQSILRKPNSFGEGDPNSTILTIAHRLRTIADYDRIIVMGKGEIIEIGSPHELYTKRGTFWDMVEQSKDAVELQAILRI